MSRAPVARRQHEGAHGITGLACVRDGSRCRLRANFVPLSPVSFLTRAASAFADKVAVVDGDRRYTYADLLDRSVRLASALSRLGVGRLDTVAILASNIPEFIEAMYAVPMLGAVLNPLNTRLDAANIAFSLKHGGAKLFLVDRDFATLVKQALEQLDTKITLIVIDAPDSTTGSSGRSIGLRGVVGRRGSGVRMARHR